MPNISSIITKIVAIVATIVAVTALIFVGFRHYNGLVDDLAKSKKEVTSLQETVIKNDANAKKREQMLLEEVETAKNATAKAVAIAADTEKKFLKSKDSYNEISSRYNTLIANGYRLRDPYTRDNSGGNGATGQECNGKDHCTTASSSDGQAGQAKLSQGLTNYLVTRSIEADAVVDQLLIVQEYAKSQHQWILENCNAKEAK